MLGREDIAATVICMAEAQDSLLEGPDPMPFGGEVSGLAAMDASPMGAFHTPHLPPHTPSRSTLASRSSTLPTPGGLRKSMSAWQGSPTGTPVHPVVGMALQEQWSSRYVFVTCEDIVCLDCVFSCMQSYTGLYWVQLVLRGLDCLAPTCPLETHNQLKRPERIPIGPQQMTQA